MTLTQVIDNFGLLFSRFNSTYIVQIVNFFNPQRSGILGYWPFFFAAMFFIIFVCIKGIVNIFNDL